MNAPCFTRREGDFPVEHDLTIHYCDHQPVTGATGLPIVYLPGLMRTARDFDRVVPHLADERRVITIDTRGRGRGGRSDKAEAYDFDAMIADVWALLDHLKVERFVLVGLALGAFMAWRMGAARPEQVAGIVVNDTSTETVSKVGKKMVALADQGSYPFDEAVTKLREPNQKNFRDFGLSDWQAYTRQVYAETALGLWKRDFHPGILEAWQITKEMIPSLWDEYLKLGTMPVAILRGANSEYLSQEQADRMAAALPNARTVNVQGRGHPLLLDEPAALIALREVLAEAEAR